MNNGISKGGQAKINRIEAINDKIYTVISMPNRKDTGPFQICYFFFLSS